MSSGSDANSKSATEYLRTASFSRPELPTPSADSAGSAEDLLKAAPDPAKLHPLAELGDKLDYLLLDDDKTSELPGGDTAIPSRGWSDDLCYGTGTMYLSGAYKISFKLLLLHEPASFGLFQYVSHLILNISGDPSLSILIVFFCHMLTLVFVGLALGGLWGMREGASRPLAVSNTRLRINSVLNSVTRRGTFIGNSAGVLGTQSPFLYNDMLMNIQLQPWCTMELTLPLTMQGGNTTFSEVWEQVQLQVPCTSQQVCHLRVKTSIPFSHLFRSSAGVRPALAAATFMAGVAGIWSYVKKIV